MRCERRPRLALVPARGGSQGIPRKNVKALGGRPLIGWVLSAIAESGATDRIVVSTDDDEIAAVAEAAGADVPFRRPDELSTAEATSADAVRHALDWLAAEEGYDPELVLLVQPTEPFVRAEQINATLDLLLERDADSAITVVEVPRTFHPFHVRRLDEDGLLAFERPADHSAHPSRQLDPPRYAFGNLYWFRAQAFRDAGAIEAGRLVGLPIDRLSALDLDDTADWELAEALIRGGALGGSPADPAR
jgi:CMP-N-acetylneuraminic acid synthetase